MKKIHVVGLAMFAVFAFGAIAASSAFAEDRWLIDEVAVSTLTSVQTSGTLLFTDLKAPIVGESGIECSFTLDGTVGPAGEDEITEVLTLGGVAWGKDNANSELEGAGALCTNVKNCPGALMWMSAPVRLLLMTLFLTMRQNYLGTSLNARNNSVNRSIYVPRRYSARPWKIWVRLKTMF
jgi:hypothetical protein